MSILGAAVRTPLGGPWRVRMRAYGPAALSITAACLTGFYLHQAALGVNLELRNALEGTRLPSRAIRRRTFLGHAITVMPANPNAPYRPRRRHPKILPDGAREKLIAAVHSARDHLVVCWLGDGGYRVSARPKFRE